MSEDMTRQTHQEDSLRELVSEARVLAEIGRIIGSTLDVDQVYSRFAEEVRKLIPFDRISIATVDLEASTLTHAHVSGVAVPGWGPGDVLPLAESANEGSVASKNGHLLELDPQRLGPGAYDAQRLALKAGLRSGITLPLLSRGVVVGTLNLRSKQADSYTEQDLKVAERVAAQIAGAIANSELHRSVLRDAKERAILAEIGRTISSTLDIDEVYSRFAKRVGELIQFDRININLLVSEDEEFTTAHVKGVDIDGRKTGEVTRLAGTFMQAVVLEKAGLIFHPEDRGGVQSMCPSLMPGFDAGFRSFLGAPLVSGDRVIGTLHFQSNKTSAYSARDLALAQQIGAQIAGAIANSEIHRAFQREAEEGNILAEIGRTISSSLDIEDVYERFSEQVGRLIRTDRIVITLADLELGTSVNVYAAGTRLETRQPGDPRSLAGGFTEAVMRSRRGMIVDEDTIGARDPEAISVGLRSHLVAPLVSGSEAIGALHIRCKDANAYTHRDVHLAERVADQIAGAIAASQLYSAQRRAERELRMAHSHLEARVFERTSSLRQSEEEANRLAEHNAAMAEAGRIMSSSLDVDQVYERFAEHVGTLVAFDRIAIVMIDADQGTCTAAYVSGIDLPAPPRGHQTSLKGTIAEEILWTRSGLLIQGANAEEITERFPRFPMIQPSILLSYISVPLVTRDEVIGVLAMQSAKPNAYTNSDLEIVERLGTQIAGAIANAQLHQAQEEAQEAVRESEDRYRRLVELSPDAIVVVSEGKIVFANPAEATLMGASSREELIGRSARDILHPQDRTTVEERVRRIDEEGEASQVNERKIVRLDGQVRDIEAAGAPIIYHGKKAVQIIARDITERKRAERELQRLALAVSNIGEGVVVTDLEGRIEFVNDGMERLLGYKRDELEGKAVSDLYPGGADSPVLREIMEGLLAGGWSGEAELQAKNGKRVPTLETASLISDAAGRLTGYVCTNTDIGERKQAEEALAYQARLVENVNDAIIASDERFVTTSWNRAAEKMYGWTAEEVIGRPTVEFLQPEFVDVEPEEVRRRLLEEGSFEGEVIHPRKDGTRIHTEARAIALRDKDGRITGFVSTDRDITERKKAERALRDSEQRFRILVEGAADGFFFYDREGKFIDVNEGACEMLGYTRDELLTLSVSDISVEYSDERVANTLGQIVSGVPITVEDTVRRKDGSTFPMERRIGSIEFNGDRHIFSMARDVTERKLAGEALRELAVMEERNRLARELHDSATQSFYSLALFAEAARRLADSGDIDGMTDHLRQLGETSQQALKEMRLLVYELRPLALETEGFVGALKQRLDAVEGRAGVKTRLLADELIDLPSHVEEALYRVTEEALNNTLKHAAATSVEMRIHTDAGRLELEVRDNGRGFDPDIASTQGGVGLVGIRERIEELGGTVKITSAPGEGAKIKVNLTVPGGGIQMTEVIRVLVVDDHPVVLGGLRALIDTEPNMEIVGEAADGVQAVEKARSTQSDVILLDLVMPRRDGIEAIVDIKQTNPDARILVHTSFSENDKVFPALKAGALGYLLKDSSPQQLLEAIRDVYRGESSLHPTIARKLVHEFSQPTDHPPIDSQLSQRELQVVKLLAQGQSNREIGDILHVSERTIAKHVGNILVKLHLANRTQAALYALREGISTLDPD